VSADKYFVAAIQAN